MSTIVRAGVRADPHPRCMHDAPGCRAACASRSRCTCASGSAPAHAGRGEAQRTAALSVFVHLPVCVLWGGGMGAFVSFHFYLFGASGLRFPRSLSCTVRVRCAVALVLVLAFAHLGFVSCIFGGIRIPRLLRCDLDRMLGNGEETRLVHWPWTFIVSVEQKSHWTRRMYGVPGSGCVSRRFKQEVSHIKPH
ncbi:hypothetical protein K438DRAFT_575906 [Mycena galopus ATCC 62051]|nr:hypothetical protein K438DRAFT_575906 [Mycena galopus ATCC 62051]